VKKFIYIFVLSVLVITFASFFILASKKQNKTNVQEETVKTEDQILISSYEDYTDEYFQKALSEKKIILLYFTANWCPICSEQEPVNKKVIEDFKDKGIAARRVHILDSQTTGETDALAKKFDILYQHTYLILDKNGVVYFKYNGQLKEEELKAKLLELTE